MIKHWMRPMLGGCLLLFASCSQPDSAPTKLQPLAPTSNSGAANVQPTATFEDPFAWVIGTPHPDAVIRVTAEAAQDLAATHFEATMQSLPTANPLGPEETFAPEPTIVLPLGIVPGVDCEPLEGDPSFVTTSCWMTRIQNETIRVRVSAGQEFYEAPGSIRVSVYPEADRLNGDMRIYSAPQATDLLNITAVNYPLVELEADNGIEFRFNLETRQWLDAAGIPIPIIPTITPTRQIKRAEHWVMAAFSTKSPANNPTLFHFASFVNHMRREIHETAFTPTSRIAAAHELRPAR